MIQDEERPRPYRAKMVAADTIWYAFKRALDVLDESDIVRDDPLVVDVRNAERRWRALFEEYRALSEATGK